MNFIKKAISLFIVGIFAMQIPTAVYAKSNFKDISKLNKTSQIVILNLSEKGIIKGYEDGTFRPKKDVTKLEYITFLIRTFNIQPKTEKTKSIKDWKLKMEKIAIENNLIAEPANVNKPITRLEMMTIMNRLDKLILGNYTTYNNEEKETIMKRFVDFKTIPEWGKSSAVLAVKNKLTNGISSNRLGMNLKVTREMAALSINNLIEKQKYYEKIKDVASLTLSSKGIHEEFAKFKFATVDPKNGENPKHYIFYGIVQNGKAIKGVYARDLDYDYGMTYTEDQETLKVFN